MTAQTHKQLTQPVALSKLEDMLVDAHNLSKSSGQVRFGMLGACMSQLSLTPSNAAWAPDAVRDGLSRFYAWDERHSRDLSEYSIADFGDVWVNDLSFEHARARLTETMRSACGMGVFVIGLGGDHSVTWPLVDGWAPQYADPGLIQLDIHHDVREWKDVPSNGSPIRGLVQEQVIKPERIVQVGIHPFANARRYGGWCRQKGIHTIRMDQVQGLSMEAVARDALTRLRGCDGIYLTVDIDVLDRAFAPGTVAALPGGLAPHELAELVAGITRDKRVTAMDIVEFDPSRDVSDTTAWNAVNVIANAMSSVIGRDS